MVRGRARGHRVRPPDRLGRIERARHLVVVVRSRGRDRDPGRDRRAIVAVRRGELRKLALLFAVAPDPRGDVRRHDRLRPVARAAADLRRRARLCRVGLDVPGPSGSLSASPRSVSRRSRFRSSTPSQASGIGLLEPAISRSVWHRDRIDTLTLVRNYDGTPGSLRAVTEATSTQNDPIAVATPVDVFLAPLAGPQLSPPATREGRVRGPRRLDGS